MGRLGTRAFSFFCSLSLETQSDPVFFFVYCIISSLEVSPRTSSILGRGGSSLTPEERRFASRRLTDVASFIPSLSLTSILLGFISRSTTTSRIFNKSRCESSLETTRPTSYGVVSKLLSRRFLLLFPRVDSRRLDLFDSFRRYRHWRSESYLCPRH